eukprot:TRINITY_DN12_c0_g1_i4.p1 TRINITY_DN12_c0_g1~~TRINITY_DN12_c0_g1_i4.p1  ORF type:complete len:586 (-),score=89.43 TRINITY_DN12_c0_g1_i4:807-2477(-)
MILRGQNFCKILFFCVLYIQICGVCGDAEFELRSPNDIYATSDILVEVAEGSRTTYSINDYAQVLLTKLDLIEALDIGLLFYSCAPFERLLQAIQCQKNLASEETRHKFEQAIDSPVYTDIKSCLKPFKDECIVSNLEDEVKNLEITNAADVDKAVDTLVTAMKFGNSSLVENILISVANDDTEGIERTSKVVKGIVSTEDLTPQALLKTFDGVLNKDFWSASEAVRDGIATALEEDTYSEIFIQSLALEIKQQLGSDRRRSLLQAAPKDCRQLLINEVKRTIRENIREGQQCGVVSKVFPAIQEYAMTTYGVPERTVLEYVIYDQTLCPCLGIAECSTATAPLVQVYILSDATGSMGPYIESVKSSAEVILDWLISVYGNLDIAIGSYRDCQGGCSGEDYYYRHELDFTPVDEKTSIIDAIQKWKATGGGDGPEAQLYALDKIGKYEKWSDDAARLLIWFGDAPGKVIEGVTLDTAFNSISSKDIVVFAIDLESLDQNGEATKIVGDNGWLIEGTADLDVTLGKGGVGELELTGFAAQVTQFIMKFVECSSVPGS